MCAFLIRKEFGQTKISEHNMTESIHENILWFEITKKYKYEYEILPKYDILIVKMF
jgi:hypothetical protein